MKKRVPAGGCEARKKYKNKALQRQQQGRCGEVSQGVKMAELVVGLAIRIALMAGKQQAQEAAAFANCGFVQSSRHRRLVVAIKLELIGHGGVGVNHTMQQSQHLRQQQDKRKRRDQRHCPAPPHLAIVGWHQRPISIEIT